MLNQNQKIKQDDKKTKISPEEVLTHGIMQLDGTYRYKEKLFDENGKPLEVKGEKGKNVVEKIIKKENKEEKSRGEELNELVGQKNVEKGQQKSSTEPKTDRKVEEKITPSVQKNVKHKDIFTEYSREKIQSLVRQLPQEVRDVLTSDKEVDDVSDICKRYKVEGKFMEIQKMILYVALGLRSMEDFKKYIKNKVAKNEEDAGKIYREIFRFVFFPVKNFIGVTYKTAEEKKKVEGITNRTPQETIQNSEKEKKTITKDKYREPIE